MSLSLLAVVVLPTLIKIFWRKSFGNKLISLFGYTSAWRQLNYNELDANCSGDFMRLEDCVGLQHGILRGQICSPARRVLHVAGPDDQGE